MNQIHGVCAEKHDKLLMLIVGTRPGIVMFAPIIKAFLNTSIPTLLLHSGQHYDKCMDAIFFGDLDLPEPDYRLNLNSAKTTQGAKIAAMIEGIEEILIRERPFLVLVGGDANTNLAGALAARKLHIQIGHIEAGERSYDWCSPEEHNRRMIDHISEHLFVTSERAKNQLEMESVQGSIHVVGNPIMDTLVQHRRIFQKRSGALDRYGLNPGQYALLTTHREENVDRLDKLKGILLGVHRAAIELQVPVLFLIHPRTRKRMTEFGLWEWLTTLSEIRVSEPVGYVDFQYILANSRLVFTDSGGLQKEAIIHRVPTVTLLECTEWVETLECGANRLVGTDPEHIVRAAKEAVGVPPEWPIPFGDGTSGEKIANICKRILEKA